MARGEVEKRRESRWEREETRRREDEQETVQSGNRALHSSGV